MGVPGLGQALARFGPVGQDVTLDDGDVGVRVQGRGGQQAGRPGTDDDGPTGAGGAVACCRAPGALAGLLMEVAL